MPAGASPPLQPAVTLGLGPDRLQACHIPLSTAEPLWLSHPTHRRTHILGAQEGCDGLPDPLGRLLDFPVPEMGVAQRRADIGMAKQAGDHRHRHAVHHCVAGMGMPEIVKANTLDASLAPGAIPEREVAAAGPGGIARRGKYEGACAARSAFENAPGRGIEGNDPGPRLAVGEDQPVAIDFRPAQPEDLASAAPGQEQKPDDIRLLTPAMAGLTCPAPYGAGISLPVTESV